MHTSSPSFTLFTLLPQSILTPKKVGSCVLQVALVDIQADNRPIYRSTIGRQSTDYRSTVDRQSTDNRPIYRPTVSRCISRYVHIYRSTAGRYIGPLSADLSVDYRPIVGQLSTDSWSTVDRQSVDSRWIVDR